MTDCASDGANSLLCMQSAQPRGRQRGPVVTFVAPTVKSLVENPVKDWPELSVLEDVTPTLCY